ncbi:MAG: thioredoxin family protein [Azospira oryzae]|nr:MAG: thioredoxin family protein [Azospira oryzae]
MNFDTYLAYHKSIVDKNPEDLPLPYSKPDYYNYTKLNWSRSNRWLKKAKLSEEVIQLMSEIREPQQWIIITEPWCGDAAHSVPFLHLMSQLNPLITVDYELRDAKPFRINDYLTRNGKSIPKLIIRDTAGNDLATWGPRPEASQKIYDELTAITADVETTKTALQNGYNEDAGKEVQKEIASLLKRVAYKNKI